MEGLQMNEHLGIDNVLFEVGDLETARAHYSVLGFEEHFALPAAGVVGYKIGPERPGLLIRAAIGIKPAEPGGAHLWVEVPDALALAATLDGAVPFSTHPKTIRTGWVFEIADPWGNVVGFTDYVLDSSRARQVSPA
jgi:catechol 2,3-dioxygenase-like lactoylglutathione lyase family enzyme